MNQEPRQLNSEARYQRLKASALVGTFLHSSTVRSPLSKEPECVVNPHDEHVQQVLEPARAEEELLQGDQRPRVRAAPPPPLQHGPHAHLALLAEAEPQEEPRVPGERLHLGLLDQLQERTGPEGLPDGPAFGAQGLEVREGALPPLARLVRHVGAVHRPDFNGKKELVSNSSRSGCISPGLKRTFLVDPNMQCVHDQFRRRQEHSAQEAKCSRRWGSREEVASSTEVLKEQVTGRQKRGQMYLGQ
jgi:hypothetical protein